MPITRRQIDAGFAEIERAPRSTASVGSNKTQENPNGTLCSGLTSALFKEGKIRVEVFAHNWRVIEILTGPHAGKRTLAPPYKYATKPYLVLPASSVSRPDSRSDA